MDFIITIDTEADNQWSLDDALRTENGRYIPRVQALCDRFGFKPTYLCTYEMAADVRVREALSPYQASGRAEVGAHLHPWSTPPFERDERVTYGARPFPHEGPIDRFRAKMTTLTTSIAEAFERAPTSYRAGRFGFDHRHIDVLLDLGYVVDCSVVPYTSYRGVRGAPGGEGGIDFRAARPGAYCLNHGDCTQPGESGLLEVPVTVLFPRWPARSSRLLQKWSIDHAGRLPALLLHKCGLGPRWLRPDPRMAARDLLGVYRAAMTLGLPCAEMMFHSSELMPGGAPAFPDASSIESLYRVLETTFAGIAEAGARAVTLTEFALGHRRQEACRGSQA
jgi:hypothetical protein